MDFRDALLIGGLILAFSIVTSHGWRDFFSNIVWCTVGVMIVLLLYWAVP